MAFDDDVARVMNELVEGDVVSYGWVAAVAGYPGRARVVGRFLLHHGDGLPWWRVVRADGSLVAPDPARQAKALRREGAVVVDVRVLGPVLRPSYQQRVRLPHRQ